MKMTKAVWILIMAGLAGMAPSVASAFTGNLVECTPSTGIGLTATLKPGLTCAEANNVLTLTARAMTGNQFDHCAANASAPWDAWVAGKVSKLASADAATISKAELTLKVATYHSCVFDTSYANASPLTGKGTITFFQADGVTKVKNGKVQIFGSVGADIATISAQFSGIVTKGFGTGGSVHLQIGLDIGALGSSIDLQAAAQCNTGGICPADVFIGPKAKGNAACTGAGAPSGCCADLGIGGCGCVGSGDPAVCCTGAGTGNCLDPIVTVPLRTDVNSKLTIDFTADGDCTGDGTPYSCCTGAGTGKCS